MINLNYGGREMQNLLESKTRFSGDTREPLSRFSCTYCKLKDGGKSICES